MSLIGDAIDAITGAISGIVGTASGALTYANIKIIQSSVDSVMNSGLLSDEQKQGFLKSVQGSINDMAKHVMDNDYGILNDQIHKALDQLQSEVDNAVCFTKGTLISTPGGDVPVETLQQGDIVDTRSGPKPIKWIGYRSLRQLRSFSARGKRNTLPVKICANAIADGVPNRAISVSAWHHIFIDKVLVRAMDLINGHTIFQEEVNEVTYYHLELDSYDMLLAANLYSESFTDNGRSRGFFSNVAATELPADWANQRGRAPRPGFKVVRSGDKDTAALEAIQQRLMARIPAESEVKNNALQLSA
ncbi:hypothetical protein LMG33810_002519 [Carnimonas sp. LMG 33810]